MMKTLSKYRWLAGSMLLLIISLAGAISLSESKAVRAERETLPITFAHATHTKENCLTCHHNLVDEVGFIGTCINCHEIDDTVAHLIEHQFHTLCRGCHMDKAAEGLVSGPTRSCTLCHVDDEDP